jgi:anti-sigma regulatory factor (Ser/Thr protein kinase)
LQKTAHNSVELVASELVTNAVTHATRSSASGAVILSISFCPREGTGAVIVRVRDDCPSPPHIAPMNDLLCGHAWRSPSAGDDLGALILGLSEGGRGLRLVADRARLGWYRVGISHKVVWAEILVPRPDVELALAGALGPGGAAALG